MQNRPEKGNAPEVAATGASSEVTQDSNQGSNMFESNAVEASSAIAPDLEIIEGQITTTSLQIAEHFGKAHRSVLLAVRRLECSDAFRLHNFVQSSYRNEQGKEQPCYRLTRDGFVFLAMGFTGKDAAQWKEAYITAFNKMEQELLARTTRPHNPAIDYDRISPAQAQDLKEIVAAIVKAGVQGYGETWTRLQRKFRVNSYLELPATQHLEARKYLIAKLPQGYAENVEEATRPSLLPEAQAREITVRLERLGRLFHPFSDQAADVIGVLRALRGLHPATSAHALSYLQLLPRLS